MGHRQAENNQRIWQVITMIPAGKVATYGDVAGQAGLPGAARRVGYALRQLPEGTRIPWHRVINARGCLSLPATTAAGRLQRERLEAEGVQFLPGRRISLEKFRWQP